MGAEPDAATGALGLDQASLVAKALTAPSAKAATAAIIMDLMIPGRLEDFWGLITADISF